jgi:hypothetical protein
LPSFLQRPVTSFLYLRSKYSPQLTACSSHRVWHTRTEICSWNSVAENS